MTGINGTTTDDGAIVVNVRALFALANDISQCVARVESVGNLLTPESGWSDDALKAALEPEFRALTLAIVRALQACPIDGSAVEFAMFTWALGYEWSRGARRALATYDKAQAE
jgi:hypothetical protein